MNLIDKYWKLVIKMKMKADSDNQCWTHLHNGQPADWQPASYLTEDLSKFEYRKIKRLPNRNLRNPAILGSVGIVSRNAFWRCLMHPSLVILSQEHLAALEDMPAFELHLSLMLAGQLLSILTTPWVANVSLILSCLSSFIYHLWLTDIIKKTCNMNMMLQ